jgi:ribosomal protein S18 acetylase RimI-like enzyme
MNYRNANQSDLDNLMELYKQLDPKNQYYDKIQAVDVWNEILKNDSIRYFIAEDNGNIVGTCFIIIILNITKGVRPFGIIENVVVDEKYRKKGIGNNIMNLAIEYARSKNCYKVQLMSNSRRIEAHSFYEKLGFNGTEKRGFNMYL